MKYKNKQSESMVLEVRIVFALRWGGDNDWEGTVFLGLVNDKWVLLSVFGCENYRSKHLRNINFYYVHYTLIKSFYKFSLDPLLLYSATTSFLSSLKQVFLKGLSSFTVSNVFTLS